MAQRRTARPLPIRALYVLDDPRPSGSIRIEPLGPGDAFIETIRAAFNLLLRDRTRLTNQFMFASQVADVYRAVVVEVALAPDRAGRRAVVGGQRAEVAHADGSIEIRIAG